MGGPRGPVNRGDAGPRSAVAFASSERASPRWREGCVAVMLLSTAQPLAGRSRRRAAAGASARAAPLPAGQRVGCEGSRAQGRKKPLQRDALPSEQCTAADHGRRQTPWWVVCKRRESECTRGRKRLVREQQSASKPAWACKSALSWGAWMGSPVRHGARARCSDGTRRAPLGVPA